MATYLVTGGNGYIGSHMCKLLSLGGHRVVIIDDHSSSPKFATHSYGQFFSCDIESNQCTEIIRKESPDAIFHFAAKSIVSEGEKEPFAYYNSNFNKTLTLLKFAVEAKVPNFVFSSTCAVFGNPLQKQIDENHPKNPTNTYGRTKYLIEQALRDLAEKGLLSSVVLRYFNAAGCSPDGEIGENHEPETHLIPNLCKSQEVVTVYGDSYPTADGTCIRDYIHVDDLVLAHLLALDYLRAHPGCHDFNLGSERGYSVQEVIDAFELVKGSKVQRRVVAPRKGDAPALVANSGKAQRLLNWKAEKSLVECIQNTHNYMLKK